MASLLALVALVASMFMAFTVGANSNSAPIAPAVGANALSTLRGALLVGIVAGLGAISQGGNISETIGHGLITGVTITPLAAAATLLTAATLITIGNSRGYPIPSAFTVTGAAVGAGVALGGGFAVGTYLNILGFWFAIPIVEGVLAYALARVLIGDRVPDHVTVPVLAGGVGYALAMIRLSVLPAPQGARATVAGVVARHLPAGVVPTTALGVASAIAVVLAGTMYWQLRRDVTTGIHRLLVGLALAVVFTSGGSQVGLATGPLEPVFESALDLPAIYLLVLGGVGILVGGWVRSPRLIQAVAREYASLGPKRSIAAFIPAFLTAQAAIMFGYPISFNKVMISSIIGAGLVGGAADTGGVSVTKTGYTVAAWVGSMVGGAVLSFGLYRLLAAIPGLQ
ncbi:MULTISPECIES: inorganic phosphate transporter [Halobacterium]|uniref:inorganic phosphate transporter n=1 Tax=Halobacterium TaxID=2239 RepID=UPI0019663279|nr:MULTISPECIES: inorganic phosphate transporter [Halobacterium]MCF2164931.1 inorganic phosphate transporter family protein [Halobacterium salinarum]MCF2168975.1 inorganic phosphate transporter family protein [Halobacterium salinarum]MCF2237699.1 inorganic phosphate transporter family protein [Halobacterium salinarum]MDL0132835.1 inorganic phosphate transporter [Halobacterium salinarum]QRY21675.1 anion permease [Halobacterium sp. GSL-19]